MPHFITTPSAKLARLGGKPVILDAPDAATANTWSTSTGYGPASPCRAPQPGDTPRRVVRLAPTVAPTAPVKALAAPAAGTGPNPAATPTRAPGAGPVENSMGLAPDGWTPEILAGAIEAMNAARTL